MEDLMETQLANPLQDLVLAQAEGYKGLAVSVPIHEIEPTKFEVHAEGPPDFPSPAPDRATYLTVSDIAALIRKWPDHEYRRLWQVFNVKSEWVHTTKYPPGFTDTMFAAVASRLRDTDGFIESYVGWCLSTARIWSKEALAKYVVRLACIDVLLRMIQSHDIEPPATFPVRFTEDGHGD